MLQHEGDPSRCVVLLPGVRYFSQAPLLWFAREAAQAGGWSVVEVDERAPAEEDPFEWMRGRAEEALEVATGAEQVVVIGKSLGSAAAPMVSGPAIWLTPLLTRPEIAGRDRVGHGADAAGRERGRPVVGERIESGSPVVEILELERPGSLAPGAWRPGDFARRAPRGHRSRFFFSR